MRILLVEDDETIAKALEAILTEHHYVVDIAADGQVGWEWIEAFTYDLIVLDIMLPGLDGIQFCRQLRAQDCQIPVLLLTAQNSSRDRVVGLDAGADDYMVKPFEPEELLARLRVLLRRRGFDRPTILEWLDLRLDPSLCEVTYKGQPIVLTPKEYRLLELFLRHPQRIFNRSVILDHLWSCDDAPGEDTITVHIKGLRQKLKRQGAPADLIQTVYGQGYRLKQATPEKGAVQPLPSWVRDGLVQQKTRAGLAEVWEKYKSLNRDRCLILEQIAKAMLSGPVPEAQYQRASRTAHQLAGALGIFGLKNGSALARQIEHLLQTEQRSETDKATDLLRLVDQLQTVIQSPPKLQHQVPLLLIVDSDIELVEQISSMAVKHGIAIERVPSLSHYQAMICSFAADQSHWGLRPETIFVFNLTTAAEADLIRSTHQKHHCSSCLTLFIADHDDLALRVKAARLGTHVFLNKSDLKSFAKQWGKNTASMPPGKSGAATLSAQVLEVVQRARSHMGSTPPKVMVVDDDPQILAGVRSLLEPWGVCLATLEEPRQFWQQLEDFAPNLLLLDIQMPYFNGLELCQVVRNSPKWKHLPIVFLTMHLDPATMQQAIAVGGNDYVNKAINGKELVQRTLKHLYQNQFWCPLNLSLCSVYE
jgi:DNA-binding response OmpR family regulator/HPt (histidine-containing phosphotransfer) domain-containing protein